MRAEDVSYQHIRDHQWPMKFCAKCARMVPTFHEHIPKKYVVKIAHPEIEGGFQ